MSGIGASRDLALKAIASFGGDAPAVLADFMETLDGHRDKAKYKNDPYELFGVNGGSKYTMSIRRAAGMTNDARAHLIAGLFMGQNEQSFRPPPHA